jgi:hypothetical protein
VYLEILTHAQRKPGAQSELFFDENVWLSSHPAAQETHLDVVVRTGYADRLLQEYRDQSFAFRVEHAQEAWGS